jgi:Asp-tRNA(Asn)/Glu-tRNA(Gln) amidotransferase A subunit family amidase
LSNIGIQVISIITESLVIYFIIKGTIPVFQGQDTVGPVARSIDDIVLSYSIMMGRNIYDDYKNKTRPKLKIGYFKRFYMSFNVTNDFGNFSYSIDDQINKTTQKAFQNLKELQQEIIPIEMPLIDFKKFLSLSVEIVIASTSAISACAQEAFDNYFQNKLRFESDAPYNSLGKFIESPLLSKEWKNYFSGVILNDTKNECKMKKDVYNDFRKQYIDFFEFWFIKEGLDILAFPTSNTLPFKFNQTDDSINVNPSVLSPFLGYPSLNIPIGFSNPISKNSDGLPIGMLMLTKRANLLETFKLINEYEKTYLNETKLPKITPMIIKQSVNIQLGCLEKFFSSSNIMIKSSITPIFIFIILCQKIIN